VGSGSVVSWGMSEIAAGTGSAESPWLDEGRWDLTLLGSVAKPAVIVSLNSFLSLPNFASQPPSQPP
jgi:hypothetical protein